MKKIFLSVGAFATIVAPLAIVVSCNNGDEASQMPNGRDLASEVSYNENTATITIVIPGKVWNSIDTPSQCYSNLFVTYYNAFTKYRNAKNIVTINEFGDNFSFSSAWTDGLVPMDGKEWKGELKEPTHPVETFDDYSKAINENVWLLRERIKWVDDATTESINSMPQTPENAANLNDYKSVFDRVYESTGDYAAVWSIIF